MVDPQLSPFVSAQSACVYGLDICITVRVKPETKRRLAALARNTRRSESLVIEEALEQYLEINEWQLEGIKKAVSEADAPDAVFVDHEAVLARPGDSC